MPIFEHKLWQFTTWPLSLLFGLVVQARNRLYNAGVLQSARVEAFVISIGNISVGGTGKTPTTIYLADQLRRRGYRVGILSRGYGRRTTGTVVVSAGAGPLVSPWDCGDEPYLMAQSTQGVPVCVDADRVRGAKKLIQDFSVDIVLLDDGFQHRRLYRDMDLVLFDPHQYEANPRLLPAGPFREPLHALARAHCVWVVQAGEQQPSSSLMTVIEKYQNRSVFWVKKEMKWLWNPITRKREPLSCLRGKSLFCVAGIAQPSQLYQQMKLLKPGELCFRAFHDHVNYTPVQVAHLVREFFAAQCDFFVTTKKDWIKLATFTEMAQLPVRIAELEMSLPKAEEAEFFKQLTQRIESWREAKSR